MKSGPKVLRKSNRINEPEAEGLRERWRTIFPVFQNPAPPPSAVERIGGLLNWPAWNDRTYPLELLLEEASADYFRSNSSATAAVICCNNAT